MDRICFSPGPTQLHACVPDALNRAIEEGILSRSHRSEWFSGMASSVKQQLFELLGVPADYRLFYVASATEAMERTIQNLVRAKSHHFVAGSFGDRFYQTSLEWGREASLTKVNVGDSFDVDLFDIDSETELICITQNETSAGTQVPVDSIHRMVDLHSNKLIAVDVVSTCPYAPLDYSKIDVAFFSVQKCFGLPAGLGVMIVSPKAMEAAAEKGVAAKGYHSFDVLGKWEVEGQTPETPNVQGIYLLNEVLCDYLKRGIEAIRSDIDLKFDLLDSFSRRDARFEPFVSDHRYCSRTAYGLEYKGDAFALRKSLATEGIELGAGYGDLKKTQSRIANFPVHSVSDFNRLVEALDRLG